MSESRTVTCDACGYDLTYTGNCIDYRLALVPQEIPSKGGAVTAMMVCPPIEHTAHFCGTRCLKTWISDRDKPTQSEDVVKVAVRGKD